MRTPGSHVAAAAGLLLSLSTATCGDAGDADGGGTCMGGKCDDATDLGEDEDYRDEPGVAACVEALEAIPVEALHAENRLDPAFQTEVEHAVRVCLSHYIRINTSNPRHEGEPGETGAAHFFAGIFQRIGIPFQFTTLARDADLDRLSIVGTLQGRQREESILLLNHTDVVRADGAWKHDPFSGDDDGEFVWGRGALDMKIIGIQQLVAMSILQRSGRQLQRDIHFVGAADEEVGGAGAEFIAIGELGEDGRPTEVDPLGLHPAIVLNEGGTAIEDALMPGRDVFLIGVEEKGLTWMQIASPEPTGMLTAMVRANVARPPPAEALPESSIRADLGTRCSLAALISDEEQKTNVQPRQSTVTLACTDGSASRVEEAVAFVAANIEPHPDVTVTEDGSKVVVHIEQGGGGHGSTHVGATALDVALATLVATGQISESALQPDSEAADRFFSFALSPANMEFLGTLARVVGPITGSIGDWLGMQDWFVSFAGEQVGPLLPSEIPFRNTCSWTAFDFPIDGEARAKLDCRLIHQFEANDFESQLVGFMAETADVELRKDREDCFDCFQQQFNASPFGPEAGGYEILRRITERSSANAIVTPYLFPASSDSFFFRLAGVPTYGFMAASLTEDLLTTFHAIDERFPIDQMFSSQKVYTEALLSLADTIVPAPADEAHSLAADVTCVEWDEDLIGDDTWKPIDLIECSLGSLGARIYACEVGPEAPRFIRVQAQDHDVELNRVDRLTSDFVTDGPPPADETDPRVEQVLFRPRDATLEHRLFEGQEFEIDTGTGDKRQFLIECELPMTLNIVDDSELAFYRD